MPRAFGDDTNIDGVVRHRLVEEGVEGCRRTAREEAVAVESNVERTTQLLLGRCAVRLRSEHVVAEEEFAAYLRERRRKFVSLGHVDEDV